MIFVTSTHVPGAWATPFPRSRRRFTRIVLVAIPAFVLSRQPGFQLRWIWYLSVVAVALQMSHEPAHAAAGVPGSPRAGAGPLLIRGRLDRAPPGPGQRIIHAHPNLRTGVQSPRDRKDIESMKLAVPERMPPRRAPGRRHPGERRTADQDGLRGAGRARRRRRGLVRR